MNDVKLHTTTSIACTKEYDVNLPRKARKWTDFNLNPLKIYAFVCMTPYFMAIECILKWMYVCTVYTKRMHA